MSTLLMKRLLGNHSLVMTTALHLLPGVLIFGAYWWVGLPVAAVLGYPSLFGFLVAALIVLLPWELGLLLYLGRLHNGRWTLDGIVLFRDRVRGRKLAVFVAGLSVWALLVAIGLAFVDAFLLERFFSWLPERFQLNGFNPTDYSVQVFTIATALNLLLFGIAGPLIEELYFRGFLLPRMADLGRGAPVLNTLLFVFYHLWTPWMAVTRILFVFPMVWLVWKRQSIYISIWTHCLLNCIGILLTYGLLMSAV